MDLRRNFGQDNAILTGLRVARGRAIAIMDDDLQHDPADLPALLAKLDEGPDVVYADFRIKQQAAWKNLGSWFNGKVAEWVLDKPKGIYLSPYKVLRREVAELICRYEGPEPYVDGLLFQVTVAVRPGRRSSTTRGTPAGAITTSSGRSPSGLRLATGHSVRPLRLVTWCGLGLGLLGGLLAVVVILYRLLYPERVRVGGRRLGVADGRRAPARREPDDLPRHPGRVRGADACRGRRQEAPGHDPRDPQHRRDARRRRSHGQPTVPHEWRGEPCPEPGLPQPLLYESLMLALYGRHYAARFRAIAELIPAGSSVLELCCGPGILFRALPQGQGRRVHRAGHQRPVHRGS